MKTKRALRPKEPTGEPRPEEVMRAIEAYFARVGQCKKCGMPLDAQHDEANCRALADLGDDGKETP